MKFLQKLNVFIPVILVLALLWIGLTTLLFESPSEQSTAPQAGFYAPDFTVADDESDPVALSDFEGQAVLLNFWASWCKPCQAEMPAIQHMHDKYGKDGLVILAVNVTNQDSISNAKAFLHDNNLSFDTLFDTKGTASDLYRVQALPTTFFITPDGIINEVVIGGPMSEALLETRILRILGR